ncbi:MAG: hypothetical protein DWB56_13785 [Candidatus Jettenia sp.]|uniref:hypothetical protein n=1 Tax=Candidatus Jettenia sp. AMX1 TaxID=2293637 RepID=UPI00180FE4FC|nr:hypothetical protein [Candidatus Jettenia sp. AMX1]MBC6930006.1 hypothetical protein [Candidatus Jettenia sp.]MDL1940109.1 hypothetical protein [Candidatus Jettenia sp. AMX1]NUN24632.1 hypothetical protein [Candidatus Jettenia caeni]WKZ16651.1 MAG: hypothetical protein QY317_04925 [Candidatus Jettenia caeni]
MSPYVLNEGLLSVLFEYTCGYGIYHTDKQGLSAPPGNKLTEHKNFQRGASRRDVSSWYPKDVGNDKLHEGD